LRAHLVVVAAVLGLGVVVTGFVVSQTRTSSVAVGVTPAAVSSESASVTSSSPGGTPLASGSSSGVGPAAQLRVHVLGSVAKPGIVHLPAGSRVADAIAAAGGLTANADPAELNLAAVVPDGAQIVIGTKREPRGELRTGSGGAVTGSVSTGTGTVPMVDLNSATQAQLEALPGIGEVTAARILEWRQSHGRFTRIEELQEVSGIGEKTFQQLAPYVRV
jgi:competence protein ComEA